MDLDFRRTTGSAVWRIGRARIGGACVPLPAVLDAKETEVKLMLPVRWG